MRWLGPLLHMLYPPSPDRTAEALAAVLDQRRDHLASLDATRQRLERLARDPVDAALHSIIEDL